MNNAHITVGIPIGQCSTELKNHLRIKEDKFKWDEHPFPYTVQVAENIRVDEQIGYCVSLFNKKSGRCGCKGSSGPVPR